MSLSIQIRVGAIRLMAVLAIAVMGLNPGTVQGAPLQGLLSGVGAPSTEAEGQSAPRAARDRAQEEAPLPDLSEIIPLKTGLSARLLNLRTELKNLPDVSGLERRYTRLQTMAEEAAARVNAVKTSSEYNWVRFTSIGQAIQNGQDMSGDIGRPLAATIRRLAGWNTEWMAEENRWSSWESRLLTDQTPDMLKSAFSEAHRTIDTALNLIREQLDTMLRIQAKGAAIKSSFDAMEAETRDFSSTFRRDYILAASPPMFSPDYFSQFRKELWHSVMENFGALSWSSSTRRFMTRHMLSFVLQSLLLVLVTFTVYRNRRALEASDRWRVLAARPLSTGFFVVILIQLVFYEFIRFPVLMKLFHSIVGGIAFIRLLGCVIAPGWKRQAAYGTMTIFILTRVLTAVVLPLPLYRLYTLSVCLLVLWFFPRWIREAVHEADGQGWVWTLRSGPLLAGVIVITQLLGKEGIAAYLFESSLYSLTIALAFGMFVYMVRGGLRWAFFDSPLWKIKLLRNDAEPLSRRMGFLVEAAILGFAALPIILTAWGVYGSVGEATSGLLSLGFDAGSLRVTVGLVIAAVGMLYGSFLLSWILPKVLLDEVVTRREIERGVRISVSRLIQYFIIFIGFLLTLGLLGLDFTKLTIILSALGLGIGFGLQAIVNNFVSGLILLFERPLRVGDTIELGGNWSSIKEIGLRATTVRTFEEAELVIPNADLINNQVTNWTLSNRQARLAIAVGVAYGSNVPLVMEKLLACAGRNEFIAKSPAPQVLFVAFGESSLNFEVRAWVLDVDNRLRALSEIHQEIDRSFREAKIEIAFPQRDLHLRSVDESITLRMEHPPG